MDNCNCTVSFPKLQTLKHCKGFSVFFKSELSGSTYPFADNLLTAFEKGVTENLK